jgi:hypothetical protein
MSWCNSVTKSNAIEAKIQMGISRRIFVLVKTIGANREHTPKIRNVLKMFEPTTFPIAMSVWPSNAEMILIVSSGIDVPTATTVRPTINCGTRRRSAKATEPSVSIIAAMIIKANEPISNKYSISIYL